jgi:hypothetical protein
MPTISYFYGIAIRMYLEDHNPPHFHANYGGNEAYVSIATGEILEGRLPRNAARLVKEWTLARQSLLMDNWKNARSGKPIKKVPGLDADESD